MKELILGGARSGKSSLAERLARDSGRDVTYVATAKAGDEEMERRIALHRKCRPENWGLIEEPYELAEVLRQTAAEQSVLIVDCLTLWLTNLLLKENEAYFLSQRSALLEVLPELPGRVLLVSNEVGMGIVPMGELSRRFQDESGLLHQQLASYCDRVILTVAGLPLILKGETL
ncbi:MAG: bifunctional adenosylcobinamide kinase/adenosylcobinamide-phosphate guanylyltransferase [Gammaproteobacteria bacterium]|nr:bifunctional adenosylcobinamide kinase/adenosylcobinamide-phosphate guanylyltransferase [Gammaproteobacteria bacterium]